MKEGHEVTLYFSNANIAPEKEYQLRLEAAKKLANTLGIELIVDSAVSHKEWLSKVAKGFEKEPEGGARCSRCFAFSLARAAAYAKEHGFDVFTTSLTVSKYKNSDLVFSAGETVGGELFLKENFKEDNGYKRSVELSKKYGLYRQWYCGCEYSMLTAIPEDPEEEDDQ